MKTLYKIYVIGFSPNIHNMIFDEQLAMKLIEECDVCVIYPNGLPIGMTFQVHDELFQGKIKSPNIGDSLVIKEHIYGGKVVIAELQPTN